MDIEAVLKRTFIALDKFKKLKFEHYFYFLSAFQQDLCTH